MGMGGVAGIEPATPSSRTIGQASIVRREIQSLERAIARARSPVAPLREQGLFLRRSVLNRREAQTAFRLEGFNGYGYHGKGVNSPYLYGGSTCYGPPEAKAGKYVRDHVFDPNHVDQQLGTLVILRKLMELDASVRLGDAVPMQQAPPRPAPAPTPPTPQAAPTRCSGSARSS